MYNDKKIMIMKTIAKKTYINPQMQVVLLQNQQTLLTGSTTTVNVGGRPDWTGGDIGDDE